MGRGRVVVFDSRLWAKIPEKVAVELLPIIWDQDFRDPVFADNVPLDKALHIFLGDGGQGFSFFPFGEVAYADY